MLQLSFFQFVSASCEVLIFGDTIFKRRVFTVLCVLQAVQSLEIKNRPLRKPVLGCATIATAAVPPAEFAMVSTRRMRGYCFLMVELLRLFLWSLAVVITKRPSENPVHWWESR